MEGLSFPHKTMVTYLRDDGLGERNDLVGRAIGEQQAESIAAQPRHRIAFAHALQQQGRDLAQQLVARRVTGAVVHRLELIEIEETQGVLRAIFPGAHHRLGQPPLELAAVHQSVSGSCCA